MKSFLEYLLSESKIKKESAIDIDREGLDLNVFDNTQKNIAKLLPNVKAQIIPGIKTFSKFVKINKVYLIGSILTYHYANDADLDVTILIDPQFETEELSNTLTSLVKQLNGDFVEGTNHPINYFVKFAEAEEYINNVADNIYDFITDRWIKTTKDVTVKLDKYMKDFDEEIENIDLNVMKLRRNLIDIEKLSEFNDSSKIELQMMIDKRLKSCEKLITKLYKSNKVLHDKRNLVFKKKYTLAELKKLKSKNLLPENIIYKLVSRYYYIELINTLKQLIDDGQFDQQDVGLAKSAIADFGRK